jgi:Flp pilus assembly protein TadG
MIAFLRRQIKAFHREDGTATTEFVIVIPLLIGVFMASLESGLIMVRSTLLEQSVDMTMRNLRLGQYPVVDADLLKTEICSRTIVFPNCQANIMIEMRRVSTSTWALPTTPITCVEREEEAQPVVTLQIGQQNDVMLVRVCIVQDLIFPTTGLGLAMPQDAQGGIGLIAESAFVTEPI